MAMLTLLAEMGDYFTWYQLPLVAVLILLLIFWRMYRKKQM